MSKVDKDGMLVDARVVRRRFTAIEHGPLKGVHAIVVHQTGAATSDHTFNSYRSGGNGAHFLIDKNGQIYQTASLKSRSYHVGRLIKSKCLTVSKSNCGSAEMAKALAMSWTKQIKAIDEIERAKSYPASLSGKKRLRRDRDCGRGNRYQELRNRHPSAECITAMADR